MSMIRLLGKIVIGIAAATAVVSALLFQTKLKINYL